MFGPREHDVRGTDGLCMQGVMVRERGREEFKCIQNKHTHAYTHIYVHLLYSDKKHKLLYPQYDGLFPYKLMQDKINTCQALVNTNNMQPL